MKRTGHAQAIHAALFTTPGSRQYKDTTIRSSNQVEIEFIRYKEMFQHNYVDRRLWLGLSCIRKDGGGKKLVKIVPPML